MDNNYKEFPFDLTQTIPFKNVVFLYDCGLLPFKIIDYRDKFITSDKCPSTYGDVIRTLTVNGFSFNFTKDCDKCQIKYCDTLRSVRGKTVENLLHNIFKHCYNIHRMDLLGTTIRSWSNCFRDPYPINYNVDEFHKRKCSYYVMGNRRRKDVIKTLQYLTFYHFYFNCSSEWIYYSAADSDCMFYVNASNEVKCCEVGSDEYKKIKRRRKELKWSDIDSVLKITKRMRNSSNMKIVGRA